MNAGMTYRASFAALFVLFSAGACTASVATEQGTTQNEEQQKQDVCPTSEPGYDPLNQQANACGADKVCVYDAADECPRVHECKDGSWSFSSWPQDGSLCKTAKHVCVYGTPADGEGETVWTICGSDLKTHSVTYPGYDTRCPNVPPSEGDPCPASDKPCNYGGCPTIIATCDPAAGFQLASYNCD